MFVYLLFICCLDNQIPGDLLVPYGTNNGDILLAKGPDVISTEIDLTEYFLIGSLYTNVAYVSTYIYSVMYICTVICIY